MGKRIKIILSGIIISALFLLVGCDKQYRDTRKEIDRIYKAAEKTAEDRATAYISKKYGIEAEAKGYWVQANYDFFTSSTNPNVVVFMEYGDKRFCAVVHAFNETILWDNYQKAEIDAVLQQYLSDLYSLPKPFEEKILFRLEYSPSCHVYLPWEWQIKGYDHTNMVDFYFNGQSTEELLSKIKHLEYSVSWLSLDRSLDSLAFRPEDWNISGNGYVEWNFRLYTSPESKFTDVGIQHPDIASYPYFLQWRHTLFKKDDAAEPALSTDFIEFHSVQREGITFATTLSCEMEEILHISDGETEWSIDSKNNGLQTYKLVSKLYEVTEKAPDSNYIAAMSVPTSFTEQHKNPLYILSRNKETGKIRIEARISTLEELSSISDSDQRRDYKIHANGIQGMSVGYQYVLAEKIQPLE